MAQRSRKRSPAAGFISTLPPQLVEDVQSLAPHGPNEPLMRKVSNTDNWRRQQLTYAYLLSLPVWHVRAHLSAQERLQAHTLAKKAKGTLKDALQVLGGCDPASLAVTASKTASARRVVSRRSKRSSKTGSST
jgi:hypothetical protein